MSFTVLLKVDPQASLAEVLEVMEDYESPKVVGYEGYGLDGGPSLVLEFSSYRTCLDFLMAVHTADTPLEKLKSQIRPSESHCLAH